MVSFGHFARTTSLPLGFHLGTLHGYISLRPLTRSEFLARTSNKTCLDYQYSCLLLFSSGPLPLKFQNIYYLQQYNWSMFSSNVLKNYIFFNFLKLQKKL